MKEKWPESIIKRTKKVIILLCTERVLALVERLKSNFVPFNAEETIFFWFGMMTVKTLKNIIHPKIIPTDKKENRGPKIVVKA